MTMPADMLLQPIPASPFNGFEPCAKIEQSDELFFPDDYSAKHTKAGKGICFDCPIRRACLDYALGCETNTTADYRAGIYGGATPIERRHMWRRRGLRPGDADWQVECMDCKYRRVQDVDEASCRASAQQHAKAKRGHLVLSSDRGAKVTRMKHYVVCCPRRDLGYDCNCGTP